MLIHEGDSRTAASDRLLAAILAFVAGGVNSSGYLAYGFFSANMTGNVSMASELLPTWQFNAAFAFLIIVGMFIFGAFIASLFIEVGKRNRLGSIYALILAVEALILMAVGAVVALQTSPSNGIVVVGLLSLTMGIQNAASTRLTGNRIRTTHISGVATDIGVGLALLLRSDTKGYRVDTLRRLNLHLVTIFSFAWGGVLGVIGFNVFQGTTFCMFSAVLLALSVRYLR